MTLCLTSLLLVALSMRHMPARAEAGVTAEEAVITEADDVPTPTTLSASVTPTPAVVQVPTCAVADELASGSGYDEWRTTLLDTTFRLPAEYEPPDLVPTASAFPPGSNGHGGGSLRAVVIDDLRALLEEATGLGHELAVQSAYRSFGYQESTFQYWVDLQGYEHAIRTSARAGHSEHQLGTAVDFRSLHGPAAWDLDDWGTTPEGAWLASNAWRYGFVMSYPAGKEPVTCYAYEPWHFRYVGRELAQTINASGSTPREVMWSLLHEGGTTS